MVDEQSQSGFIITHPMALKWVGNHKENSEDFKAT